MAVQEQTFEMVWPALSGRLSRVLRQRRVPAECIDDVVQETGLRLLKNWGTVDHDTIWSLTITIAGNIIKDDMRRRMRDERFAEAATSNSYVDIEERAIARVELWKTHRAIDGLNATQRTALLSEVYGFENTLSISRGAAKMTRMRARRHLRQVMGRASGLVALTGHRIRRALFGDPRVGLAEGASQTMAAALLMAAALDVVMLGGGVFRSQPPSEVGRISSAAPFELAAGPVGDGSTATLAGSGDHRFLSPGWTANWHAPGSEEEMIGHSESVGPNGANSSVRSSLLGQRTNADVGVNRDLSKCSGTSPGRDQNPICAGTIRVHVLLHHNGKTYGARANSDGEVSAETPFNLPGN